MRRTLFDGGLTVNGDKKLAVFGIAAACVIGLINHMQYNNQAYYRKLRIITYHGSEII